MPQKSYPQFLAKGTASGIVTNILAYTTWSEVVGSELPLEEIADRFAKYSLPVVLGVLQRIDFLLSKEERPDSAIQDRIGVGLLGEKRWLQLVDRAARSHERLVRGQHRPLLWFHQQVLNAGKVAFLVCPDEVPRTPRLEDLGEAILGLSDHVVPPWDGLDAEETEARIRYELTLSGVFNEKERVTSTLPLGRRIYLRRHEHLQCHPHWMDLSDLFVRATGLTPDRFLTIAMVVWAYFERQNPANLHQGVTTLDLRRNLEGTRVKENEIDAFLAVMARSVDAMRAETVSNYSLPNLQPFSFVPFAETPLVAVGDHQYCLSFKLFLRRITTDLHFFYLQHLSSEDRTRYLQFHGVAFEDVVHNAMGRACRRRRGKGQGVPLTRYRRVDDIESGDARRADGIAQLRDVAVVLDAKAGRVPSPAFRGDSSALDEYLDKVLIGAARQIEATIRRLQSGNLRIRNMPVPNRFLPVVVTSQSIGWNAALDRFVARRLADEGLLQDDNIGPLMPVELESLMILADRQPADFSLVRILQEWYANSSYRLTAFHNFLVAMGDRLCWEIPALRKETQAAFGLAVEVFDPAGRGADS